MFYCESCRVENNWPTGFSQSRGPCELCGITEVCYDLPSSWLPETKKPPVNEKSPTEVYPQ